MPDEPKEIVLGPLFTIGAAAIVWGLLRRSRLAIAAGAAAIWADRRSRLGASLTAKLRPPPP